MLFSNSESLEISNSNVVKCVIDFTITKKTTAVSIAVDETMVAEKLFIQMEMHVIHDIFIVFSING